jgi:hypothetical protein
MARFETDSYFPEPMWGQKQRAAQLDLPTDSSLVRILFSFFFKSLTLIIFITIPYIGIGITLPDKQDFKDIIPICH